MTKTEVNDPIELLQRAISELRSTPLSAVSAIMLTPSLIDMCEGAIADIKDHLAEDTTLEVLCNHERYVLALAAVIVGLAPEGDADVPAVTDH